MIFIPAAELISGLNISEVYTYFIPLFLLPFITLRAASESYELNLLSAGIAMRRHSGKISLCSAVSLVRGSFREENMKSARDFKGGRISAGIEYSVLRHLGIFAEGGYMQLFA